MLKLAITGGICSGKTKTLSILNDLGYRTISSDNIVHDVLLNNSEVIDKIISLFPVVESDHGINKQSLASLIFSDKLAKESIESILHPVVKKARIDFFNSAKNDGCSLVGCEIPLYCEKIDDLQQEFSHSVLIKAPIDLREERFKLRENAKIDKFHNIVQNQLPDNQKEKMVNFIINNDKSDLDLEKQIKAILEKIIS